MKTAKEAKSKGQGARSKEQGARSRKFLLIKVFNCPRL